MLKMGTRANFALVGVVVALSALVAIPESVHAVPETNGTLIANDRVDVYDATLDFLLDFYIGSNYHSQILAFTECYGGDKIDEFSGDPNTTILTADVPGETALYGGYGQGLAFNLFPGRTTDAAHSGALSYNLTGDTPTKTGPNLDVGTGGDGGAITSTHVLVWAGMPEQLDQVDINAIHFFFEGQPNTTVRVLAGDGTGPNADLPATLENLVFALESIGYMMNPSEQFILFVTDHGGIASSETDVECPATSSCSVNLDVPSEIYDHMTNEPDNTPYLALLTQMDAPPILPDDLYVTVNAVGPLDISSFTENALDYNGDSVADQWEYQFDLGEWEINSGTNSITLDTNAPIDLAYVSLHSGAIRRLPEPGGPWQLGAGVLALECVRRWRKRALQKTAVPPVVIHG